MMVVKRMLKDMGVIDAANGYLSSYSLILLIITYLQSEEVLPRLQPEGCPTITVECCQKHKYKFKVVEYELAYEPREEEIRKLHEALPQNDMSVSQLVIGFVKFMLRLNPNNDQCNIIEG